MSDQIRSVISKNHVDNSMDETVGVKAAGMRIIKDYCNCSGERECGSELINGSED